MWNQDKYLKTLDYAATVHKEQTVPGKPYSYVVHFAQVAQEIMAALCMKGDHNLDCTLAVQCALLHDVMEDAGVTYEELAEAFGVAVAEGVLALTKNTALPKEQQMGDSIRRIRNQPKEIWMVKMADRIVNLQEPPDYWTEDKIEMYKQEAQLILEELKESSVILAERLEKRIKEYPYLK